MRAPPADYLRLASRLERAWPRRNRTRRTRDEICDLPYRLEWLALPTRVFQEVAERCPLHTVPHRHSGVLAGLVNIRGELLLCASLGSLLGIDETSIGNKDKNRMVSARILVANRGGNRLAFAVDEAQGVLCYHPRELKPLPATLANAASCFTIGMLPWQERTVGCLDDELLFTNVDRSFG